MSSDNIIVFSDKNKSTMCTLNGKTSKIRNGSNSPIKHIMFSNYSQYSHNLGDVYWKGIFENASHDSFRKGYKFNGDILSIKIKNVIKKHNINPKMQNDTQSFIEAYERLKMFITETSGASSHKDDNSVYIAINTDKTDKKWSGNTPPKYQISMLHGYVDEVKKMYKLSDEKAKELNECIILMIYNGDIKSEEIHCENYEIKYIDNITFSENNFKIIEKMYKPVQHKKKRVTTSTGQLDEKKQTFTFKSSKNLSLAGGRTSIYT